MDYVLKDLSCMTFYTKEQNQVCKANSFNNRKKTNVILRSKYIVTYMLLLSALCEFNPDF